MKKTIILILAVLPIILLVVIAFAGQILSLYSYIPVERVEFVDRLQNAYTDQHTFTLAMGATKETAILIYPELSSNKEVTYKSSDESICTIDENGVITGVKYGTTTVKVTTKDGNKSATLNVRVRADIPIGVTLSHHELSMIKGAIFQLEAVVEAPVAVDKTVRYESSDTNVIRVNASGMLTAINPGTATITVTTESGEKTDTCTVTVVEGVLPISFDFEGVTGITYVNGVYEVSHKTINLRNYLKVIGEINKDEVEIKIQSGTGATLSEAGVITFEGTYRLITVRAEASPDYKYEIKFVFKGEQ